MTDEINKARLALWNQFLQVPHRDLTGPVSGFSKALIEDPDFIGKAMYAMTLPKFNTIRDLAEAGIIVLLSAPGEYQILRRVGAHLLGRVPPYQLIRVDDFLDAHVKGHPNRHSRKAVLKYLDELNKNQSRLEGALGRPGNRAGLRRLSTRYHYTHPNKDNVGWIQKLVHGDEPEEGTQAKLIKTISQMEDPVEQARLAAASNLSDQVLSSILIPHPATMAVRITKMTPNEAMNARGFLEGDGYLAVPEIFKMWEDKVASATNASAATIEYRKSAQRGADAKVSEVMAKAQEKATTKFISRDMLVILDMSGSTEPVKQVCKRFAKAAMSLCKGKLMAVGVNNSARPIDLNDLSLIKPQGGTSIGVGLDYARRQGFVPDTVLVFTDDAENQRPLYGETPGFEDCDHIFIIVPSGDFSRTPASESAEKKGYNVQKFMIRNDEKDYAALDQVVTMLANTPARETIVDRILNLRFPVQ